MNEMNKIQNDRKKNLQQENIKLQIENEVIRGQLKSVYNIIGEILKEPVKKEEKQPSKCINCQKWGYYDRSFCPNCLHDNNIKEVGEVEEKEKEKVAQAISGDIKKKTPPTSFIDELKQKQEAGASLPSDFKKKEKEQAEEDEEEKTKFKCFQCQTVSDDAGAYKRHGGKLYCVDCLDELVRGK